MAKRIYCLDPKEREKECIEHSFQYKGRIPCTGPQVCIYCGTHKETWHSIPCSFHAGFWAEEGCVCDPECEGCK